MSEYEVCVDRHINLEFKHVPASSSYSDITIPLFIKDTIDNENLFEKYMIIDGYGSNSSSYIKTELMYYTAKSNVLYEHNEDDKEEEEEYIHIIPTLILYAFHYCLLNNIPFKGVHYAFLMSHKLIGKKKDTNIGISKNPIIAVVAHNNQAYSQKNNQPRINDKDTASAAPDWRLDTVLGPFPTKRQAIECSLEWVKKTRGIDSKRDKAPVLAESYRCDMYSSQINISKPLDEFLIDINAPYNYIEACHNMKEKCLQLLDKEK